MGRIELSRQQREALETLLDEAAAFDEAGEHRRAEQSLAAAERLAPGHPDVAYERLRQAIVHADDPQQLRDDVDAFVRAVPGHADARHLLGSLALDGGDHETAVVHFREVLRLDQARGLGQAGGASATLQWIETQAREVLDSLPEPFASMVRDIPVVLEARPHPEIVAEAFDPRALGLFEGPPQGSTELAVQPTRIVLFWANLLEATRSDAELAEEIEVTLLHEIGHFFGLDEDDVEALGLG